MTTPDITSQWHYRHLGRDYFEPIYRQCKQVGVWPLVRIYTEKGEAYIKKTQGRDVNPHWMVEDAAGNFRTDQGGYRIEHRFPMTNVHTWNAEEVATRFDLVREP